MSGTCSIHNLEYENQCPECFKADYFGGRTITKERIEQLRELAQNKKVDTCLVQEWEAVAIYDIALAALSASGVIDATKACDLTRRCHDVQAVIENGNIVHWQASRWGDGKDHTAFGSTPLDAVINAHKEDGYGNV